MHPVSAFCAQSRTRQIGTVLAGLRVLWTLLVHLTKPVEIAMQDLLWGSGACLSWDLDRAGGVTVARKGDGGSRCLCCRSRWADVGVVFTRVGGISREDERASPLHKGLLDRVVRCPL